MATRCHKCYYSCNIFDCNKVFYSQNSTFCKNSYLLQNCDNCNFCFWCENLSQKSYCINNIQYSKEEYFDKLEVLLENTDFEEEYYKSKQDSVKYMFWYWNETVSWNYIFNSSNAVSCYHVKNLTDWKYCSYLSSSSKISQDCYDYDYFGGAQRVYESITTWGNSDSMLFCSNSWEWGVNNFYSIMCYNCKNVFWCIWLKRKEYCVFNKQYTKEEYEKIVPQIIEYMQQTWEWWEFFPIWMSPFWYNESIAQTYFPLNKRETRKLWAKYSSYTAEIPKVEKVIQSHRLPKQVNKIPNDILNWAIECEETWRNFRITPQELNFYRKHNIAVPTKHPERC